ncbi:sulfotransferase [Rhodovulum sp. BSW8]|uniref:sulfotransferase family protein n=1 Tax=Rhodovulum sp. BSW8 TaxID=2259645 RepID=UPI000DE50B72|nr:sulfotransferase [Rhodovulum sp. BSW8]RBO52909.1 sulfotransferase [Rhodovulum sp. BSW8]
MTHPDFIIIGAMKSGTTTLAAQLAAQQGLFLTDPKEPNFFSDDEIHARGPDWYAGLFAAAPPGALKGEASTHYTKLPTYPDTVRRLAAAGPAPKLIYMIRNPLDRAVSHYIHEWTTGEIRTDLETALERHPTLTEYGRYGMQIAPFAETFGPDRILLTSLEGLKADPEGELGRISAFIGLETPPVWQSDLGARNVSAERFRKLPFQRLLVDNPLARALRHALVPKALRERVRRARSITRRPELSEAARARLIPIFAADRDALARVFPDDPALGLCYPFLAP